MPGSNYHHISDLSLFLRVQSVCVGGIYIGYSISELLFNVNYILSKNGIEIFDMSDPSKPLTKAARYMPLLIGPIICVSGFIVSYFIPFFTTKIERRQCMIISDLIYLLATIFTQLPTWELFMISRLLMGTSCAIDLIVTPLYIREISPDNMAGKTGCLFQANIFIGGILAFLMQIPVDEFTSNDQPIGNKWRIVFVFPAILSLIRIISILVFYKIDTPYHYYRKGDQVQGKEALQQIYQEKYVPHFVEQHQKSSCIDVPDHQAINQRKIVEQQTLQSEAEQKIFKTDIQQKVETIKQYENSYKNRLRVGIVVNFCQQMTGCIAFIGLSNIVIGQISSNYELQRCIILGTYFFLLFVAVIGVTFNRKLARKKYLVGGFLLCSVFQFILAIISSKSTLKENITLQFIFLLFIFFFYAAYSFTVGPVTVILTTDILKDRGLSYSMMAFWLGIFFSLILLINPYQYINHIIYGSFAFLGFLFSINYIAETRWLNFSNIQELYKDTENDQHERIYNEQINLNKNLELQNLNV
ncbi:MFS transporter (macronuclear) [Tetrahymena thermophila SB210]|uniref:Hexose transporter 1 n=1 Tax=Tetrahymena thermophila (strain SB210) TaxID=312017 RepID=Q22B14_TETTS|nr:MFS transporter [Tetrahymena thermophila SB210]EAR82494.1 MFS transporter [Tetrahymena thermophila SB210]|eukprot:XP_001030157.1 MFS transporter [Tetrahymena thermophila SB210]